MWHQTIKDIEGCPWILHWTPVMVILTTRVAFKFKLTYYAIYLLLI